MQLFCAAVPSLDYGQIVYQFLSVVNFSGVGQMKFTFFGNLFFGSVMSLFIFFVPALFLLNKDLDMKKLRHNNITTRRLLETFTFLIFISVLFYWFCFITPENIRTGRSRRIFLSAMNNYMNFYVFNIFMIQLIIGIWFMMLKFSFYRTFVWGKN
jgi:hypothetical protein